MVAFIRHISGASADDQTRFILDMVNTGRFVSLAVTLLRFDLSKDDITGIPPFLIHEMLHCCESNGMEPGKQSVVTSHHRDISNDTVLPNKKTKQLPKSQHINQRFETNNQLT